MDKLVREIINFLDSQKEFDLNKFIEALFDNKRLFTSPSDHQQFFNQLEYPYDELWLEISSSLNHNPQWQELSVTDFNELIKNNLDIESLMTLFQNVPSTKRNQLQKESNKRQRLLELCSTPKKPKRDTSTSTMSVITTGPGVNALFSEEFKSSQETLEELLESKKPMESLSGITGSNISLRHQGEYYVYKSKDEFAPNLLIDLKIYDDMKILRGIKSMDYWKKASFRAKLLMSKKQTQESIRIHQLLTELKKALIAEMITNHRSSLDRTPLSEEDK